jgi:hypothetical protein
VRIGLLHVPQVVSDDGDERSLEQITEAIVGRRLRKLEGLRAYLRRFVVGCGRSKGGEVHAEDVEGGGESFRSPVSRLDSQQTFLIGKRPRSSMAWFAAYRYMSPLRHNCICWSLPPAHNAARVT